MKSWAYIWVFLNIFLKNGEVSVYSKLSKEISIQAFKPAPLSKGDSNKGVLSWNLQNFLQHLFHRTPLMAASVAGFPASINELIKKIKN